MNFNLNIKPLLLTDLIIMMEPYYLQGPLAAVKTVFGNVSTKDPCVFICSFFFLSRQFW